ncbi:MAG TPA: alpha/beta hydrolase [Terriglobales bacterium]|nr:alpha/beta hydrolase [Terriglobales bacterium]
MRTIAADFPARLDDVQITAPDGAPLRAWHIQREHGNGNAVILLHGLGDNRLGTVGYAELFLAHGYDVLMPDARAHGVSGGRIATCGILERNDVKGWFEWLEAREHSQCIYGFAESMGAAQLLESLDAEPNFCAVVAESSFSSFREIAYDRMGQYFHAGPWVGQTVLRPVIAMALAYTRWKYHVNLTNASPQDSIAHSHVPVLLIHGQVDSNIPVRHSRLIKTHDPAVTLWEVPGADHCGAISVAPQEFEKRVVGWFSAHQNPRFRAAAAQQTGQSRGLRTLAGGS